MLGETRRRRQIYVRDGEKVLSYIADKNEVGHIITPISY